MTMRYKIGVRHADGSYDPEETSLEWRTAQLLLSEWIGLRSDAQEDKDELTYEQFAQFITAATAIMTWPETTEGGVTANGDWYYLIRDRVRVDPPTTSIMNSPFHYGPPGWEPQS